jgi:opacity protein-like surface antigen
MWSKTAGLVFLFSFLFAFSASSVAQKNEISFSVGAITSSDQGVDSVGILCPVGMPTCNHFNTSTNVGVAFGANYARQLSGFGHASLDVEFPIVGVPGRDVQTDLIRLLPTPRTSQSSIFFTPSARVKFLRSSPVSPFLSVGGGLVHHHTDTTLTVLGTTFSGSNGKTNGAFQFGGGLDFKTPLPHLEIRAEVRDFWARGSSNSSSLVRVSPERQHNIFAGGGVVFKF